MTEELKRKLVKDCGLSYQTLSGKTADALFNYFMDMESKELIAVAKHEAEQIVKEAKEEAEEYLELYIARKEALESLDKQFGALIKASEEFGIIPDEKAKDIIFCTELCCP